MPWNQDVWLMPLGRILTACGAASTGDDKEQKVLFWCVAAVLSGCHCLTK